MDPESIVLSEMSETEQDIYYIILKNKQAHRYREQIGGGQTLGRMVEGSQTVQTSSYKLNKS